MGFVEGSEEGLVAVVAPTASARIRLRPLDANGVRLTGGLLGDRQRVNGAVTIFRGHEELERAGTLDNFRIAAGRFKASAAAWCSATRTSTSGSRRSPGSSGARARRSSSSLPPSTIELVEAAQEPDGYLNTWCRITDPAWRWTGPRARATSSTAPAT